jgi:hypothetical protein
VGLAVGAGLGRRVTIPANYTGVTLKSRTSDAAPGPPQALDAVGGADRVLMLPDSDHALAHSAELPPVPPIPALVVPDLRLPPLPVVVGLSTVLRTTVPEAAIDEDGHLGARKADVWAAGEVLLVEPISQATAVKLTPHCHLRLRVPRRHLDPHELADIEVLETWMDGVRRH